MRPRTAEDDVVIPLFSGWVGRLKTRGTRRTGLFVLQALGPASHLGAPPSIVVDVDAACN